MLIHCRNKAPKRIYHVAGQAWTFTRATPNDPLVCDVTCDIALNIFLTGPNKENYYLAEPIPAFKREVVVTAPAAPAAAAAPAPASEPAAEPIDEAKVLLESIEVLIARKQDGDFTGDGVPNCRVLTGICGFQVTKAAMFEIWNNLDPAKYGLEVQQEQG